MCENDHKQLNQLIVAGTLSWWEGQSLFLRCLIQTNASTTEFIGQHDDRLKIRLAAQPLDGKANDELQKFIAKEFGVAKNRVSIVKGKQSKLKLVRVDKPKLQKAIIGNT